MYRYTKKLAILCVTTALLGATLSTTEAASLSSKKQQMQDLQTQDTQTKQQVAHYESEEQALNDQIAGYEASIANIEQSMNQNNEQTAQIEQQISAMNARIAKTQVQLDQYKKQFGEHIRNLYEDGGVTYLSVLFSATSFQDFLTRWDFIEMISKEDKLLADRVLMMKNELNTQKVALQQEQVNLSDKRQQLLTLQQTYQVLKKQQQSALQTVEQNLQPEKQRQIWLESQIQLTSQQINAIEEETARAQVLMNNASYIEQAKRNLISVNRNALIQYANQFLGTPYVWGGTSPSGFDCSGFTQYVFTRFGITLNRTAEEQYAEGIPVSSSALQPDDLVFFSTYAPGATHVGIYIGNGLMIDAQDYGVSIDNIHSGYWGPKYIGARRFVKS